MAWAHAAVRSTESETQPSGLFGPGQPVLVTDLTGAPAPMYSDVNRSLTLLPAGQTQTDGAGNLHYVTEPGIYNESCGTTTSLVVVSPHPGDLAAMTGYPLATASPWQASTAYTAGQVVFYAGSTYSAKTNFTSGSVFNPANWNVVAFGVQVGGLPGVACAATANVASLSGTTTLDGIAAGVGTRVFLAFQSTGAQNGPWVVQSGIWTRPPDFAAGSQQLGVTVEIEAGTTYGGTFWSLTNATPVTVDTTAQTWARAQYVDLVTNQTIGGIKTFSAAPVVPANSFPESATTGLVTDLAATEKTINKGAASGYAPLDGSSKVPVANSQSATALGNIPESQVTSLTTDLAATEKTANKGVANGYASLDSGILVPVAQIPSLPESKITNLTTDLAAKATDSLVVHLSGTETITGAKTFSTAPVVPSNSFPESATTNLVSDLAAKLTATFGTPSLTLGTAAATGAAGTVIRSDATIVAFDATVPVTQAFGDTAATGSAAVAARRDHKHGMPTRAQTETTKFTDAVYTAQMPQVMLSGSFVPNSTQGYLSTDITAQVKGEAFAAFDMYWGTPATSYPAHQGDALAAGANQFRVGVVWADTPGSTSRHKLLTGLTPGTTYNWQLMLGITGGSGRVSPVGNGPYALVATPDARRLFCTNNTDGTVHVINIGGNQGLSSMNQLSNLDSYAGLVTVGTNPQGIAITPDGTKVVVCNKGSGNVTVINTSDLTIQGTYTMPGTTPQPLRAVCTSNTRAYITDFNNAKVHSLEILTGTWGSAPGFTSAGVTVGTNPQGICVLPDLSKLYIANYSSQTVTVITVSTGAVAATVTMNGASPGPTALAAMPDSSAVWVVCFNTGGGGQRIQQIVAATNALGTLSEVSADTGLVGIAIDPDGQSAWVSCTNGWVDEFRLVGPYAGNIFVRAQIGTACNLVALDKFGWIFIADTSNSRVWVYPGSQVACFDTNSVNAVFGNQVCSVEWTDA